MNIPAEKMTQINDLITNGPDMIAKAFFVVSLVMYAFYALVMTRQVKIMTQSIESEVNIAVKLFGWVHFLLAVLLVVVAIVLL